jgi:hypothetical protein
MSVEKHKPLPVRGSRLSSIEIEKRKKKPFLQKKSEKRKCAHFYRKTFFLQPIRRKESHINRKTKKNKR